MKFLGFLGHVINHRFFTTEQLKQILKLYIYFVVFNATSSVKLFEVTVQIFV